MNIFKILLTLMAFSQIHAADDSIAASVKRKRGAYEDIISTTPIAIDADTVKANLIKRIRSSKIDKPVKLALQQIINLYWHAGTDDSSFYILGDNKQKMIAAYRMIGQSVKGRNAMTPVPELFYMAEIVTLMMGKERFFNTAFRRDHKEQTEAFDNRRCFLTGIEFEIPVWQKNIDKVEKGKKREEDFYETEGPHYPSYLKVLYDLSLLSDKPELRKKSFLWEKSHNIMRILRSRVNLNRNFPELVIMPVMFDLTIKDILDTLPDGEQNIWLSGFMVRKDKDGELSCYADGKKMACHFFFTHDLSHACIYAYSFNTLHFSGDRVKEFEGLDYTKILAERKDIMFKRLKIMRQWIGDPTTNDQYKLRLFMAFYLGHEFTYNMLSYLGIKIDVDAKGSTEIVEIRRLRDFLETYHEYILNEHFYKTLLPESLIKPLIDSGSEIPESTLQTFKDEIARVYNDCIKHILENIPVSSPIPPFLLDYELAISRPGEKLIEKHIHLLKKDTKFSDFVTIITDRTGKPVDALVHLEESKTPELLELLKSVLKI